MKERLTAEEADRLVRREQEAWRSGSGAPFPLRIEILADTQIVQEVQAHEIPRVRRPDVSRDPAFRSTRSLRTCLGQSLALTPEEADAFARVAKDRR